MHLATYGLANSSQYWLVDNSQLFLIRQLLISICFIAIPTSFLNSIFLYHFVCLLFIEYSYATLVASYIATILSSSYVYGLYYSCVARLHSTCKSITASHYHPAWKMGVATQVWNYMPQHLLMFKSLKIVIITQSFNCLIALEASCCLVKLMILSCTS